MLGNAIRRPLDILTILCPAGARGTVQQTTRTKKKEQKMKLTFKQIARIAARLGMSIPAVLLLLAKMNGGAR
jgi:hypothetical protein